MPSLNEWFLPEGPVVGLTDPQGSVGQLVAVRAGQLQVGKISQYYTFLLF